MNEEPIDEQWVKDYLLYLEEKDKEESDKLTEEYQSYYYQEYLNQEEYYND